jgi:hypothetical protein
MSVNLRDELRSLADIEPNRDLWADALARVGSGSRFHRPRRRLPGASLPVGVVLAAALTVIAAVAFGAVELTRPGVQQDTTTQGPSGPLGPPPTTLARPLGAAGVQVSLAQATTMFGSPLALPNTPVVRPSEMGPVWAFSVTGGTTVAVTFPSKGVWVSYDRAAPGDPASQIDPATHYKDMATAFAGSQLVRLNRTTPAIYVPANDGSGTNAVDFEANGAEIEVYGNNDEATLAAIAESILAQLSSASP